MQQQTMYPLHQFLPRSAVLLLSLICFFSFTAELWSSSQPFFWIRAVEPGHRFETIKIYFPSLFHYSAQELGVTDGYNIDFKNLIERDQKMGHMSHAFFPILPWDAVSQTEEVDRPPSFRHWLGTDALGRDYFARLLYGLRFSLMFAFIYGMIALSLGIVVGLLQGYWGSTFDFLFERSKELLDILPFISILILIQSHIPVHSIVLMLFVSSCFSWISLSTQIRIQVLSLRRQTFIESAQAIGASEVHILARHILPHILDQIMAYLPFLLSRGILLLTTLDFFGFGLEPPTPSLGELINRGREQLLLSQTSAPWLLIVPTTILCLLLLCLYVLASRNCYTYSGSSR